MEDSDERVHLTTSEFVAAFRALSPAKQLRLRMKAASYAPGTGMQGDDLFQEAILRTLEEGGGRNCPRDVPISVFLDNAMRSIASGEREKYAREAPAEFGNDADDPIALVPDDAPSPANTALARIELEQVLTRLQDLFAEDAQAQAVLIGDMEGWTAEEIRDVENMDEKQYATARRRVRRTIAREFGKGSKS